MHFRMPSPPVEVEKEFERLYNAWYALPENECGELNDYLKENGSQAARRYLRECDEIRSRLQPGEHV